MNPNWLAIGVDEPEPVLVPVLDEYSEPLVRLTPDLRMTDDRFRLNAELTPSRFKAEIAALIVAELSTESPTTDGPPGVDDAL
jgi:hypothetical protein